MPEKFITRHKYIVPINYTTTLGVTSVNVYRGNGIYDPDQTSTGTSATGFTTMSTCYSYHRVYASSIKVTLQCTGNMGIIYFVVPTRTATSLSLLTAKTYSNYKEIVVGDHSGDSTKTIYHYTNTAKFMDYNTRDNTLAASGSSNPGEQWYWITGATSIDSLTNSSCTGVLEIVYFTEWSGLKSIS